MKIHNIISNSDDFDINVKDIPNDAKDAQYRGIILDIFFQEWSFIEYYKIMEKNEAETEEDDIIIIQPEFLQNIKPNNVLVLKKCRECVTQNDKIDIMQRLNQYPSAVIKVRYTNKHGKSVEEEIYNANKLKCFDGHIREDLLDDTTLWKNHIDPKIPQAIHNSLERKSNEIREKFKISCIPNKKRFADSLVTYCEIVRDLEDVHKVADRFIGINKWIKGEKTDSILMCLFNTDNKIGRNGKTQRMKLEQKYMEENGFIVGSCSLSREKCSNINDFGFHLYYRDEYAFEDAQTNFLKSINMNSDINIQAHVMYRGTTTIVNEAMFYLCCNNGCPNKNIVTSDRVASCVRTTDAQYHENKHLLTTIYDDSPSSEPCLFGQVSYRTLFDGLIKHAVPYDKKSKITLKPKLFKVEPELLNIIDMQKVYEVKCTINSLITTYTKQIKNREKAKTEIQELYKFLKEKHPEFICKSDHKNWNEKSLYISFSPNEKSLKDLLETETNANTKSTDYTILDRNELKEYIYSLFDLDPNQPEEVVAEDDMENRMAETLETYKQYCECFTPVNKNKMETEYTDPETGNMLWLIYEGVNIPNLSPSNGHTSRFTNDNMFMMPRFLVEYDPVEGSSDEEIAESKEETLKLFSDKPTFRVVDSGNKSIHILFCFDYESCPDTVEEYKFATKYAIDQLGLPSKIGCAEIDRKVLSDPSRICRKPGVVRDNTGKVQELISFNKEMVHIDWKDAFKEKQKADRKEKVLKQGVARQYVMPTGSVENFIRNYVNKHNVLWQDGCRHNSAAVIAGACSAAGFSEDESIQAIESIYDCSDDPTITSNLRDLFN